MKPMSKREYIARLTADLLVRQGRYKAQIDSLAQTKREILREVSGALSLGNGALPSGGRSSSTASSLPASRSVGNGKGWTVKTQSPSLRGLNVETGFER
jgi:hypothetical protein